MQNLDLQKITELSGMILPLPILLIKNDEDRQFLTDIYLQYKPLMYKVANQFFGGSFSEIDDAVSIAIEHLCKNCDTLKGVACNKRSSYIVSTVRNSCLTELRERKRQRLHLDCDINSEGLEAVSEASDVQEMVFNDVLASDLLNAFPELHERDRELIRMRHIDRMDYAEIAALTGLSQSAARTAVSRAKNRLKQLAMERKRAGYDSKGEAE